MKKYTLFALILTGVTVASLGISTLALFNNNQKLAYQVQAGKNEIKVGLFTKELTVWCADGTDYFTLSIDSDSPDLTVNFESNFTEYIADGKPFIKSAGKLTVNFSLQQPITITAINDCSAFVAKEIHFTGHNTGLTVYGANGTDGEDGKVGKAGKNGNTFDGGYYNAGNGSNGENGKDGYAPVVCSSLYLNSQTTYSFYSGNGGNGGKGGDGGSGPSDSWLFFATVVAANAGNGGQGGNGGNGGAYGGIKHVYDSEKNEIDFKEKIYFAGFGGEGGKGGKAGTPGTVTNTNVISHNVEKGNAGADGKDGKNGLDGKDVGNQKSTTSSIK